MNPQRVARAYKTISQGHEILSEGYAELARAYADEQPVAASAPPAPAPTVAEIERAAGAPLDPRPDPEFQERIQRAQQRAASAPKAGEPCPVHGDELRDGRYGVYCPNGAYKDQTGKWCKGRAA